MELGNWRIEFAFVVAQPHLLIKKHNESPSQS